MAGPIRASLVLGVLAAAVPTAAQTNDHVFRSFRWTEEIEAPRAAGLAGAFVAVADDSSATVLNPAGMLQLPKTEIQAALAATASGTLPPLGDRLVSRTDPGFIGGAGLIARTLAIGAYLVRGHHGHVVLDSSAPDSPEETGFLNETVTDGGVALAWRPFHRVALGGRLNVRHLALEGLWSKHTGLEIRSQNPEALSVGLNAGSDRITVDGGILVQATNSLRFGFAHRQGASWEVSRLATNPNYKLPLDSRPTEFRCPSVFSGGAAWRLNPQVLVSAQVDYVLYQQLQSNLDIRQGVFERTDYVLDNAFEPRLGVELSRRIGSLSVQLRGGVHSQAPGAVRYVGKILTEELSFPATKRRTIVATGFSVVSRIGLRLDAALRFGEEATAGSLGLAVRF